MQWYTKLSLYRLLKVMKVTPGMAMITISSNKQQYPFPPNGPEQIPSYGTSFSLAEHFSHCFSHESHTIAKDILCLFCQLLIHKNQLLIKDHNANNCIIVLYISAIISLQIQAVSYDFCT